MINDESKAVAGLIGGGLFGGAIAGFGTELGPIGCIVGAFIGLIVMLSGEKNV